MAAVAVTGGREGPKPRRLTNSCPSGEPVRHLIGPVHGQRGLTDPAITQTAAAPVDPGVSPRTADSAVSSPARPTKCRTSVGSCRGTGHARGSSDARLHRLSSTETAGQSAGHNSWLALLCGRTFNPIVDLTRGQRSATGLVCAVPGMALSRAETREIDGEVRVRERCGRWCGGGRAMCGCQRCCGLWRAAQVPGDGPGRKER
jgi:hypothetical protein